MKVYVHDVYTLGALLLLLLYRLLCVLLLLVHRRLSLRRLLLLPWGLGLLQAALQCVLVSCMQQQLPPRTAESRALQRPTEMLEDNACVQLPLLQQLLHSRVPCLLFFLVLMLRFLVLLLRAKQLTLLGAAVLHMKRYH